MRDGQQELHELGDAHDEEDEHHAQVQVLPAEPVLILQLDEVGEM